MSAPGDEPDGPGEPGGEPAPLAADEVSDELRARMRGSGDRSMQRMQALAAVVLVALFAVFALVIGGGGNEPGAGADDNAPLRDVDVVAQTLSGLPEHDGVLGDPDAPLRIVEIVDLQCSHCAAHQLEVQPQVLERFVRTGRVQLQLLSIGMLGEDSERLRNVHERLSAQDRGWAFASLVLRNQGTQGTGWATDRYLRRVVTSIPGAQAADAAAAAEPAVERRVAETRRITYAIADRFPGGNFGTPAFAIGESGEDPAGFAPIELTGSTSVLASLSEAVERAERRLDAR